MFLINRFVFFALETAKGCISENVLCEQFGLLQNIFRVLTNKITCLS